MSAISDGITDIGYIGLFFAYALISIVITFTQIKSLRLTKNIFSSVVMMTIQLLVAGLILTYVLRLNLWYLTFSMITLTYVFSTRIVLKKTGVSFKGAVPLIFFSVSIGSSFVIFFMIVAVVQPDTLYDAQYLIPLSGMITGNSMNGCALALDRFYSSVRSQRKQIETKLALGASREEATSKSFQESYKGSLLPTLSSMSGMGIVHLPGMMTGQILSGTDPLIAIKYQITIMIALLTTIALTAYIVLSLVSKKIINDRYQINEEIIA